MNNKIDENEMPIANSNDKEWPKDNKVVRFTEITDPIREALQIAMDKGDLVYTEGISWNGLKQGDKYLANINNPSFALHAMMLKRAEEDQGRDVFTEIISIAVQLGMEQGRRELSGEIEEVLPFAGSPYGKEMLEQRIRRE